MKKLISILVAFAMMATLAVTMAFAVPEGDTDTGVSVAKVLTLPKDVTVPNAEIKITALLDTVDGVQQDPDTAEKIEKTLNLTTDLIKSDLTGDAVDVYYYATQIIAPTKTYAHGGTYIYKLTESSNLNTENTATLTNTEIADDNVYTLKVYVDSTGAITKVSVYDETTKKDVEKVIDTTNIDTQVTDGVVFKNALTQIINTDEQNSVFKVGKTVLAGANGQADQTSEFDIDVAVTFPTTNNAQSATYKIHKNGVATDAEVTITGSKTLNLKLAHGEYIYFTSIPVGTKVSALETDARAGDATQGKAYVKTGELQADNISTEKITVDIQNKTNDTNDTGILMSNLPYIVLALVAIGGMVAYVVVRRRNADEA